MRRVPIIALATICLPLFVGEARAQAENRWTSPDGLVSVTMPSGWQRIEPYVGGAPLYAIGPTPTANNRDRDLGICRVDQRIFAAGALTQTQINERAAGSLQTLIDGAHPTAVHSSSTELVNGVLVLSLDLDRQGQSAPMRLIQRKFLTPTPAGVVEYTVGCAASGSANVDEDVAPMHQFLNSLTLNSETNP